MTINIVTHAIHETFFLPLWLAYFRSAVPEARLHVILTPSENDDIDALKVRYGDDVVWREWVPAVQGDDNQMNDVVEGYERELFASGDCSVFVHTDPDEFLLPHSGECLSEWFKRFEASDRTLSRPQGWQVVQQPNEAAVFSKDIDVFYDRDARYRSTTYCKPCITKNAITWVRGFHKRCGKNRNQKIDTDPVDPTLDMVHLHHLDVDVFMERHLWRRSQVDAGSMHKNQGFMSINDNDDVIKFFATLVPPWQPNHFTYNEMRAHGKVSVPDAWRGKILRSDF